MSTPSKTVKVVSIGGIGLGVWWAAWTHIGFWWALLYGFFWPVWIGFRLADFLLQFQLTR